MYKIFFEGRRQGPDRHIEKFWEGRGYGFIESGFLDQTRDLASAEK